MKRPLRVAVIGAGSMGRNHARVYNELEGVELVGVADPNLAALSRSITSVETPAVCPQARHVFHQYTVRIRGDRDAAKEQLHRRGIGTGIHYPLPVHHQPLYRDLGYTDDLPHAERAAQEALCLPVHPALSTADLERIIFEVNCL